MPLLRFVTRIWIPRYVLNHTTQYKRDKALYEPTVDTPEYSGAMSICPIRSDVNIMLSLAGLRPTVLLADDHNGFLNRLTKLLSGEFQVLGTASNGRQAITQAVSCHPDVIILDVSMPELNGLEAVLEMRKVGVSSKLVLLTVHQSADYVTRAFENGANAFVFKSRMNSELLPAIRKVLAGGTFVSPREN